MAPFDQFNDFIWHLISREKKTKLARRQRLIPIINGGTNAVAKQSNLKFRVCFLQNFHPDDNRFIQLVAIFSYKAN